MFNRTQDNASTTELCSSEPQTWAVRVGVVVAGTVAVTGTALHALVVAVLVQQAKAKPSRRLQAMTANKVLVLNMAIIHLLYCAIALPYQVVNFSWPGVLPACPAVAFFRYVLNIVEVFSINLHVLERTYRIMRSAPGQLMTPCHISWCCSAMWLLSILLQTIVASTVGFGFEPCHYKCDIVRTDHRRLLVFLMEGVIPVTVTAAAYLVLIRHILKSRVIVTGCDGEQRKVQQRTKQAIWTLVRNLSIYLACVLPICFYNIFDTEGLNRELGILLSCLYSSLFVVMTLFFLSDDKKYRKAFVRFVWGLLGQGDRVKITRHSLVQVPPKCLITHLRHNSHLGSFTAPVSSFHLSVASYTDAFASFAVPALAMGAAIRPRAEADDGPPA